MASLNNLMISILTAIAVVAASGVSYASRENDDAVPNPFAGFSVDQRALIAEAGTLVDEGDCADAWKLLWQPFRDGEPFAATALAAFVIADGLVPPGSSADRISQQRHATILALHGINQNNPYAFELLDTLEGPRTNGRSRSSSSSECAADPQLCRAGLAEGWAVPTLENYVQEIELLTLATGEDAECVRGLAMRQEP